MPVGSRVDDDRRFGGGHTLDDRGQVQCERVIEPEHLLCQIRVRRVRQGSARGVEGYIDVRNVDRRRQGNIAVRI